MDQQVEIPLVAPKPSPVLIWKMTFFEMAACASLFIGVLTLVAVQCYFHVNGHDRKTFQDACGWGGFLEMGCFVLSGVSLFGIRRNRWKRLVGLALAGMAVSSVLCSYYFLSGISAGLVC